MMWNLLYFTLWTLRVWPLCSSQNDYPSLSLDYETAEAARCAYENATVNRSTIQIGSPIIERNGSEWRLTYNITWEPPALDDVQVDWDYKLKIKQVGTLSRWTLYDCDDYFTSGATDVTEPYYVVSLLFTYTSLFQVVPAVDGKAASDKDAMITFVTPDCFVATGDADFCSTQDVKITGAPYDLNLLYVTEYLEYESVAPTLEWYAPIQVNKAMTLSSYVTNILGLDKVSLQHSTIVHDENVTHYTWTANDTDDMRLQKDTQYIFRVTPLIGSTGNTGNAAEITFWTVDVNLTVTPPPTVPSLRKPSEGPSGSSTVLLTSLIVVLLVIIVAALIFMIVARRKGFFDKEIIEEVFYRIERGRGDEYVAMMDKVDPVLKPKEITHDKITLQEELGKGQFGIVYKGIIHGLNEEQDYIETAVKTTKDGAFDDVKQDLLDEMKLMIQLGSHPNLMTLLACCTQREPYYLITEFMQYGDLLNFLRRCRQEDYAVKDNIYNVGEMEQLGMAHQIAKGMAYVQDERFYHGDLAARNVLVGRGLTLKISDFGLADDIYSRGYKRREQEQKIPIKWCSLEAILNGICSSEGDVWSYGVVLYEIFTLGGTPYPGIAARFLVAQLKEGYRMEQPEGCPDEIYKIMLQCWQEEAESRPRFKEIRDDVDAMLVERSDYLDFDLDDECSESGQTRPLSIPNIYVKAPGEPGKQPDNFAPIIEEEDNGIDMDELQAIIHADDKESDKDSNDNKKI